MTISTKYTQAQLQQCFNQVKHPLYWRLPIDVIIDDPGPRNVKCLRTALLLWHSDNPKISRLSNGKLRVESTHKPFDSLTFIHQVWRPK
jgi:hypothetical protein